MTGNDHRPRAFGAHGARAAAVPINPHPGGGDGGGVTPPWQHDGALVREKSAAEVYVLFGNARFHIGSPGELAALGYNWAQVVVVPDGATASLAGMPDRGTLLRDRVAPEVWFSLGNALWWIPSEESMRFLGLSWANVRVVPQGALANLNPKLQGSSASDTPASVVFAPNHPKKWARSEIPGYTTPNGSRIVEIRGWLRGVDGGPNPNDPDWHLQLEVDPAWLDHIGADWHTFFKVGDMIQMGLDPLVDAKDPSIADHTKWAATPSLHVEVNGWDRTYKQAGAGGHPGTEANNGYPNYVSSVAPPKDWTVNEHNGGQLPAATWPFLANLDGGRVGNAALAVPQYVRVIGSVVTDIPHMNTVKGGAWDFMRNAFGVNFGTPQGNAASQDWAGSASEEDPACIPRWTEIHPADVVGTPPDYKVPSDPVDAYNKRPERIYGVAVVARTAAIDPAPFTNDYRVLLPAPGPQPAGTSLRVDEYVTSDTRYGSIVTGNAAKSGALITTDWRGATIHVAVKGDPFQQSAGRFAAVYRLSWVPNPEALVVTQQPDPIAAGKQTSVTFVVVQPGTGAPVAGTVSADGVVIGETNHTITHSFSMITDREWVGPEPGDPGPMKGRGHWVTVHVPPTVDIACPGHNPVSFHVRIQ